jgi:hypothetical protein
MGYSTLPVAQDGGGAGLSQDPVTITCGDSTSWNTGSSFTLFDGTTIKSFGTKNFGGTGTDADAVDTGGGVDGSAMAVRVKTSIDLAELDVVVTVLADAVTITPTGAGLAFGESTNGMAVS